ncbi:hypothetical protein AHIS1_p086 [Acaryochloris phage A-HIS1]|nr:hypothetical protein AHIS1_p086 [Acaryochloris phage A-HIS1]
MKIEIVDGMLTLPSKGGEVIIEELCMAEYEKFYRHWISAMQIANKAMKEDVTVTFSVLFTANEGFRTHMWKAMQILGIENPGYLSPRVMQSLLMSHEGGSPLAFVLHNEDPSLGKTTLTARPTKMKRFRDRLTTSIMGVTSQLASWANRMLFTSGLYAVC